MGDTGRTAPPAWHALPDEEVLARLAAHRRGLAPEDAAERLRRHGPNRLPEAPRAGPLRRLLAQFDNVLIYVLIGAGLLSAGLGHWVDTAVIAAVVLANAAMGWLQEGRAEDAMDAIRRLLTPRAAVLRGGSRVDVDAVDLVPGDVVLLEPGDRVAADLRLLEARGLAIDEAPLTGESVPVEKRAGAVPPDAPVAERASLAHSGTLVTAGRGVGVVVATGADTELGRIGILLGGVVGLTTPLLAQMNAFARRLTWATLGISGLTFAFGVVLRDYAPAEMLMIVVGVAVAAIPEGLPAILTITLAIGVRRMAGRRAIVRQLPAVETLGAVSVICSDKTGTLTRNEMAVRGVTLADAHFEVESTGYAAAGGLRRDGLPVAADAHRGLADAARIAALCNDAELAGDAAAPTVSGDPMEGALLAFAARAGSPPAAIRRAWRRLDTLPFDSRHRYMATLHAGPEGRRIFAVKGAPEAVLARCDRERGRDGERPIDRAAWADRVDALAVRGERVLALAEREAGAGSDACDAQAVGSGLAMVALVGLLDPPRPDAIEAVRLCRAAGIRVKMITGDHAATARSIAATLGFGDAPAVLTGRELDALDASAFRRAAAHTDVFARTSPEHKLRLVEALQAGGDVVAMTGDGVNDSPALRRADVGVAMGRKGTEAAKDASAVVLADDDFATIVAAVREGRIVYDNVRKAIAWALPTNGGQMLAIVAAVLLGVALPISPLQILWVNLVTAVALGVTFAFEPEEPGVMARRPRRRGEPLLSAALAWRIVFVSALMAGAAFAGFEWALWRGDAVDVARTTAVNAIVACQVAYLFAVRRLHSTSFARDARRGTPAVLLGLAAIAVAQLAFTYAPAANAVFGSAPLGVPDLGFVVAVGAAFLLVVEIEKALLRRRAAGSGGER